jgi:GT2 family glycosyltransferase
MPKVSVIVINYNGKDFIIDCLRALEGQLFKEFEIILVDNGSSDDSLHEIQKFLEKSLLANLIKIIPLDTNSGFAGGNLVGLSYTEAEYIALLNNDAEPDKEWLENLVKVMEANPDIGICASKLIAFGTNVIDSAGDGYAISLKGFKRGEGEDNEKYNKQEYVFGACGGAVLYRRKMLEEIGFFDEDFFLIHEDTDLNFRAQLANWKVMYVPTAIVYHKVRSSIGHMSDKAIYYTLRNGEFVRIKNIPLGLFLRCLPSFIIGMVGEFLRFVVKHRKCRLYCKAKFDVLKMLPRMIKKRKKIMRLRRVSNEYIYGIMTPIYRRNSILMKLKRLFQQ